MAQRYTHSDWRNVRRHITYVIPRPPVKSQPITATGEPAETVVPVNLDALIAQKREKARRMRQR